MVCLYNNNFTTHKSFSLLPVTLDNPLALIPIFLTLLVRNNVFFFEEEKGEEEARST